MAVAKVGRSWYHLKNAELFGALMVQFVFAPAHFPSIPFVFFDDDNSDDDLVQLVPSIVPGATLLGRVTDPTKLIDPKTAILICSPNWPELVDDLEGRGFANLYLLLHSGGYGWGYAYLARSLPGWPAKVDFEHLALPNFFPFLEKVSKWRFEGSTMRDIDVDALECLQAAARTVAAFVDAVAQRLSDADSIHQYITVLRKSPVDVFLLYLRNIFREVQYMECIPYKPGDVILNAGLHGCAEIPYFIAAVGEGGHILCIDPQGLEDAYPLARSFLRRYPTNFTEIRQGLWSFPGKVRVPAHSVLPELNGLPSAEQPFIDIPCTTIDAVAASLSRLDVIKLDIEGAEIEALRGGLETIERLRPSLAISVYHSPSDMWQIPRLLMPRLKDYRYHYRHYSAGRWEGILYAVPIERAGLSA